MQREHCYPEGTVTVHNNDGQLHNTRGPAVRTPDGTTEWWINGQRHRLDGPAIDRADGTTEWWRAGQPHRLDGPAIVYTDEPGETWVFGQHLLNAGTVRAWEQLDPAQKLGAAAIMEQGGPADHAIACVTPTVTGQ